MKAYSITTATTTTTTIITSTTTTITTTILSLLLLLVLLVLVLLLLLLTTTSTISTITILLLLLRYVVYATNFNWKILLYVSLTGGNVYELIKSLYSVQKAVVQLWLPNGEMSKFSYSHGVKQGCFLSPLLFLPFRKRITLIVQLQ